MRPGSQPRGGRVLLLSDVFLATNGGGSVTRSIREGSKWQAKSVLGDAAIRALVVDPSRPSNVFAGGNGAWRSTDAGASWSHSGLHGRVVTSLAVRGRVVVAGLRPAGVAVSMDEGATWETRPFPRRWWWFQPTGMPMTPHVQALAILDEGVLVAGVEVGGLWRSGDLGLTWERVRGAVLDCHSLAVHPSQPTFVYEGGAGRSCGAISSDGGRTFRAVRGVRGRSYGWAVAPDPVDASVCFHSASTGPFAAHGGVDAKAVIVRSQHGAGRITGAAWSRMPYGLASERGRILCGLSDGSVHVSLDDGATWEDTGARLGSVERAFVMAKLAL